MTDDPMTDVAAAEAFTKANGYYGDRAQKVTWGPNLGKCRCQGASTTTGLSFNRTNQCTNLGKIVLADGSTWCGRHGPQAVARYEAQRDKAAAKYRTDMDKRIDFNRRGRAYPELVDALREIEAGHNDPRALAAQVLAKLDAPG